MKKRKVFDRDNFMGQTTQFLVYNFAVYTSHMFQVSKKLNAAQIEAVFAKFDSNGDGRLSMDEFKKLMGKN